VKCFYKMLYCFFIILLAKERCLNPDERFYSNTGEYYFEGCLFVCTVSCKYKGGAICGEKNNISLSLYSCSFYNCSSSDNGGAIHIESPIGGDIQFNKICFFQCFCTGTNNNYPVGYMSVDEKKNNSHHYISTSSKYLNTLTSICYCVKKGIIEMGNLNFSKIMLTYQVTINPVYPTSSIISYSNFVGNYAAKSGFLYFLGNKNKISYLNVVNNTQTENKEGIVHLYGGSNCTITYSSFCKNNYSLFSVPTGCSLLVEFSSIEHQSIWIISGSATITQCQVTYQVDIPTSVFPLYYTYYCDEGTPDQTPLATISDTFQETPSNTIGCTPNPSSTIASTQTATQSESTSSNNHYAIYAIVSICLIGTCIYIYYMYFMEEDTDHQPLKEHLINESPFLWQSSI